MKVFLLYNNLIKISIFLVEAKGDYIHVKIEDKNYTVHSTLK